MNKLARSITKWTKACDKRLNRLISFHNTCDYKQYCYVGNTAKQCRLGLFQDSDFAGDLEDSKSTSGRPLCVFGSHHHTCECKQHCRVGNTSQQCRRFRTLSLLGEWEDSKSTSSGLLCVFGSHTFVPISWMCKKQTSVSHSSTESEIISLDAGLRLDGIPALGLWDPIVAVLHKNTYQSNQEW